jgi:hypothetical protein
MTRRFLILCCLLLMPMSALAQSKDAKDTATRDAISGTWTGELNVQPDNRSITLVLKFDGKQAVTGTLSGMPNPGDVKKGTFDPKTGALKLQLGRSDSPDVLITLDGTVTKNAASGKVSGEPGEGTFKLTRKP